MTELEIAVCVASLAGIVAMIWLMGRPWIAEYAFWTHECRHHKGAPVDIQDGQECPWCGKHERE